MDSNEKNREEYLKILNNLSADNQECEIKDFEFIRNKIFGGDNDLYGQKVFKEKYLKKFQNLIPFSNENLESKFNDAIKLIRNNSKCPQKPIVLQIRRSSFFFEQELEQQASAIRDYNYFKNDLLFFGNGFFPIKEMLKLTKELNSKLLTIILSLDSEVIQLVPTDLDRIWKEIKLLVKEILEHYSLLDFLEILYKSLPSNQIEKDLIPIIESIWDFLNILLQDSRIHYLYIEPRPVKHGIDLTNRVTIDRTTRIKIFYSIQETIFQLRIDLAHQGEEFLHINLHSASLYETSFNKGETLPFSDEKISNRTDQETILILQKLENSLFSRKIEQIAFKYHERDELDSKILIYINLKLIITKCRISLASNNRIEKELFDSSIKFLLSNKSYTGDDLELARTDNDYFIDLLEDCAIELLSEL